MACVCSFRRVSMACDAILCFQPQRSNSLRSLLSIRSGSTRSNYLLLEKHPDIYQVKHRAEYPQDQNQQAASGKATIAHDAKQYGRRQRAHPFPHCDVKTLSLAAAAFDQPVNAQDRHQEVLQKSRIAGADSYSKLTNESIYHAQGCN